MQQENPQLWNDLPPLIKEAVFARVRSQLPGMVRHITDEIGNNVDQLIDAKLMVISFRPNPPVDAMRIIELVQKNRAIKLAGTDAVVGMSINNSPTVQDLWNSTPAWGFPYINSPLVPGPAASPIISGGLAQLVLGASAYAMIHDSVYLEGGVYRGLSDRWLGNLGPGADANPHVKGVAPYWRAAYQWSNDDQH